MILETIINFICSIISTFFSLFNLPSLPDDVLNNAYNFIDLIMDNLSLIGLFIRISTLKSVCAILIVLINFKYLYTLFIWAKSKIPFLNKL